MIMITAINDQPGDLGKITKLLGGPQVFQRGSMYWSAAGGAHTVHGALRNAWASQGAENGRLGYPTSDEIALNGGVGQTFQGGTIIFYPTTGRTSIAFKR